MCLTRKLVLITAMAVVALAVTAGSASAQYEVVDEATFEHCSAVTFPVEHEAVGGCRVEFQSTGEVPFFVNVPGAGVVQLFNCEWHLEARIGEVGEGYVTQATLTSHPAPSFPCTRTPCDEPAPDHSELAWPIQIEEAAGAETLEMAYCLRPINSAEGADHFSCTVHLELTDLGSHDVEIGHPGEAEAHCEAGLPFDVWLQNAHFLYEDTMGERIEVIH